MDDGEWLHAEVEAPVGPKDAAVHLCRGAGHQPMHVRVPGLAATAIAEVVLENTAGRFTAVARFTDVFPAPAPGYVAVPDGLLLNMLPDDAVRGYVVTRDLRVACFATAAPGETVAGTWLPAAPPRTVDVAQCYRDCGDLPAMEVTVELQFQSREGRPEWRRILRHRRFPRMDDPTPAPVWRDLQPPCTMRARLVVRGGHTIDDAAELRVTDLTPR
jgi:hypothetical protein